MAKRCEGEKRSAPSSVESHTVEEAACAVGVLIDIEQTEVVPVKSTEVCLVEEGGEELDLIVWEEIKGGENARAFRIGTDANIERSKNRGVQTEPMLGFETPIGAAAGFPNLATGGGLLPDPNFPRGSGKSYEPLEWLVTVHHRNYPGGRRVIRPGPKYQKKPLEGDWARHPCCGTVCAVWSAPLHPMTDRERFGPAPY